jgi:RNA polymerase sigma factor (sigma-70 family)
MPAPRKPGIKLLPDQRRLVQANRGLAVKAALDVGRRYPSADRDDLVQAASWALCHAVIQHHAVRAATWSTYAYHACWRAARNEARGSRRSAKAQFLRGMRALGDLDLASTEPDPAALAERRDLIAALRRAIDGLPERERVVIEHRLAGANSEETGQSIGLRGRRTRQLKTIALDRLRQILTAGPV